MATESDRTGLLDDMSVVAVLFGMYTYVLRCEAEDVNRRRMCKNKIQNKRR